MNRKQPYICLILLLSVLLCSCGLKKRIEKADRHFALGEYYLSGDLYRTAYSKIPSKEKELRAQIAFKQGESYRKVNNGRAAYAYKNAIQNNYPDCIVFLHYAQALQRDKKNGEAVKIYEKYLECNPESEVARKGLASAKSAEGWSEMITRYKVQKSKELNVSRYSSFSPVFVGSNTDLLVFSSSRATDKNKKQKRSKISGMPDNKLYSTRKNTKGKWEKPLPLEMELKASNLEIGVCSFTADGSKMYFSRGTRNDSTSSALQIWYSNRAGGTWSTPVQIEIFKDSSINVAHPAISADGQELYFVSDAPNGFGGQDIWRAKLEDGRCKYIENLGPTINSAGDEMFPSLRADGILYFSSDGHGGFGGLDIYKASPLEAGDDKKKNGDWRLENMGIPINSNADDFGICFEGRLEKGYFSSTRSDKRGFDAIWTFELPDFVFALEGRVLGDDGEELPNVTIRLVGKDGTNAHIQAKKDGTYRLKLEKGVDYVMLASARGCLNQSYKFSTEGLEQSQTLKRDFYLRSIFKPVQLDNIYYEFAKWDLRPDSEKGLQLLFDMLNDNPNVTIELSAHTDYIGDENNNKILSEKRAQSVVNYLIKKGVDKQRLEAIGYGEQKPFVVDASTARKYSFLKQDDVLTEDFILKLSPEEQEQCNQINRRTEFRVLSTTYNLY